MTECIPVLQFVPRDEELNPWSWSCGRAPNWCWGGGAMSEPPEVRPGADTPSRDLEPFPPLGLPFCWGFWPVEDFSPMEDLKCVLRACSWFGLFLLEEEDLLSQPEVGWHFLPRKGGGEPSNALLWLSLPQRGLEQCSSPCTKPSAMAA